MISKILNLARISQNLGAQKTYNAALPVLLAVLDKTKTGYLLRLGNSTIEAKSAANLALGAKFWANVSESSSGETMITNLIARPKILDLVEKTALFFKKNELENLFNEPKMLERFAEMLSQKAFESPQNPQNGDLTFLANSLNALNRGVLSLVIKERGKRVLLQIRRQKGERLEFSAAFNNLGVVNGVLFVGDFVGAGGGLEEHGSHAGGYWAGQKSGVQKNGGMLHLVTQFQGTKELLERNIGGLGSDFSEVSISLSSGIGVLFEEEGSLEIKA